MDAGDRRLFTPQGARLVPLGGLFFLEAKMDDVQSFAVHAQRIFQLLNWTWANGETPTARMIESELSRLIREVRWYEISESAYSECGRLYARRNNDLIEFGMDVCGALKHDPTPDPDRL